MSEEKKKAVKILNNIILGIIGVAGILVLVVVYQMNTVSDTVRENNAYSRVTSCIVANIAEEHISEEKVEECYADVENRTGLNLDRFGSDEN